MAQGQVSLENLLDFLVLCESSGFIEFKLPLGGLKANLKSLWEQIFPPLNDNQPPKSLSAAALLSPKSGSPSLQLDGKDSIAEQKAQETVNEFETSSLFDIKTPELVSTPNGNRLWQPALNVNSSDSHDQKLWTPCARLASGDQESIGTANTECLPEEDSASTLSNPRGGNPVIPESEQGLEVLSRMNDSMVTDHVLGSHLPPFILDTDSEDSDCDADSSKDVHKEAQEYSASKSTSTGSFTHTIESPTCPEQRACEESFQDNPINNGSNSPQRLADEEKKAAPASPFQKNSKERSPIVTVNSDSSDDEDEADQKLESMFAELRLTSAKKSVPKHIPSRKSLAVFIVSDSEDVDGGTISEDEDNSSSKENISPPHTCTPPSLATSVCSTPYTPYTGVVFWGSPDASEGAASTISVTPAPKMCTPFVERNHSNATLGSAFRSETPGSQPPVVTPSARKNFSRFKNDMIRELYKLFNSTVFENKLPADLEIKWNNKLRTTAGYCYYLGFGRARTARVELSTKVCDSYNRIRDTLIHELCHAATWVIDGVKGGGHGRQWKAWAQKANIVHPDLKPVSRCHNFEIAYKHTYKCTVCDFKIGRHSKSVNVKNTQCPYCLSKLELIPKLKADGTPSVKKLNQFAQFVKDNYSTVKSRSPWRNHKQVMERLKDKYHCSKVLDGSFSD